MITFHASCASSEAEGARVLQKSTLGRGPDESVGDTRRASRLRQYLPEKLGLEDPGDEPDPCTRNEEGNQQERHR